MKKLSLLTLFVCLFGLFPQLSVPAAALTFSGDAPAAEGGDGFESGDDCGYVMGTGSKYNLGTMYFTSVEPDTNQGCVDSSGYFYADGSRNSYATFSKTSGPSDVTVNFKWSSEAANNTVVDLTSGKWSGYARMTHALIPVSKRLLWFDWKCTDPASSCYGKDTGKYQVTTDLTTGAVTGYAWNDYLGFISFNELTMELPPREIMTHVDILANDTDLGPDQVDKTTAPLADGYDYWRIRVQFEDTASGEFLTESDIASLTIKEVKGTGSNVYLNQVENSGDAIASSYQNAYVGCTDSSAYCALTELDEDGDTSTSFNRFIFSGSPTSNMLGLDDDSDVAIEYYSDRDGCRWIYDSQWDEVDGSASQPKCPKSATGKYFSKAAVFASRESDRNFYEIGSIVIDVSFTGSRDTELATWDDTASGGTGLSYQTTAAEDFWLFTPEAGNADLSYRPRYEIEAFEAVYDGTSHTDISDDVMEVMYLHTEATVSETSDAYQGTYGGSARPGFDVYYQMDTTSDPDDPAAGSRFLLIDTDVPENGPTSGDVEETYRTDSYSTGYLFTEYKKDYPIGYGQKASECPGEGSCEPPSNSLSEPTAEQWVCDSVSEKRYSGESCYYTEYLPHTDRHADAESMFIEGAINSEIDEDDFLDEDYVSVLGTVDTINLRNKMYAQLARYTVGQTASSGSLDENMNPSSGLVELLNDRLIFAEGDVTIEGSASFSDKTLVVVGGDVFINGDITGGRLGIVAFRSGGEGGNVWVKYSVNNVYANLFLDGSFFSYDGTAPALDYPVWADDETRLDVLKNQLYLKGSLISRNTVNGAADESAGSWDIGDGTTTSSYAEAREYDLNLLRQYRLCYQLDTDGSLLTTTEECNEGETLSAYRDASGDTVYNPLVLEYAPASDLPIFNVANGLFN